MFDKLTGFLDTVRSGAETWKSIDGGKKSKKLLDNLDKADAALGRTGLGASPAEYSSPVQDAQTPLKFAPPAGLPQWALLAAGALAVYILVKR